VRLATWTVLIIGSLLANQVHAEVLSAQPLTRLDCAEAGIRWDENANVCSPASADVSHQPLTRVDCESAGMAWIETTNVCGTAYQTSEPSPGSQITQPTPRSEVANPSSQPLTRRDCDRADMAWNETTNVCGEKTELSATQTAPKETNPIEPTVLINIDKASQKMTVSLDGVLRYEWPVSTGVRGYTTPSGSYTANSMNKIWYSKEWDNAPMPHAMFFTKKGHAIHGTYEVKRLGKPASHGCVRIAPQNAATLYALVAKTGLKNTQVVLAGDTPGGEANVAKQSRAKPSYRRASRPSKLYQAEAIPQQPRRGGFFKRLFGGRE
jgi:lipoprotein-anchoring transpeptidase ErfK/SrfK